MMMMMRVMMIMTITMMMMITRIGKDNGGGIVLDPLCVVLRVLRLLLEHHDVRVHLRSLRLAHSLLGVLRMVWNQRLLDQNDFIFRLYMYCLVTS